jgi:hypothetical protein
MILVNGDGATVYQQFYSLDENKYTEFPDHFRMTGEFLSYFNAEDDISGSIKSGMFITSSILPKSPIRP